MAFMEGGKPDRKESDGTYIRPNVVGSREPEPRITTIGLTKGYRTLIDADLYGALSKYKWHISGDGYASREYKRRIVGMHRDIMECPRGYVVDHINMDKLDNRRENLRICTKSQNGMNRGLQTGCSSRFKGVCWHKNRHKWYSYICRDGKSLFLGSYDDEVSAAISYNNKAAELFGEFARLNKI